MIGDLEHFYSKDVLINSETRENGERLHGRWSKVRCLNANINANMYRQIKRELAAGGPPDEKKYYFCSGGDVLATRLGEKYRTGSYLHFTVKNCRPKGPISNVRYPFVNGIVVFDMEGEEVPVFLCGLDETNGDALFKLNEQDNMYQDIIVLLFNRFRNEVLKIQKAYSQLNETQKAAFRTENAEKYAAIVELKKVYDTMTRERFGIVVHKAIKTFLKAYYKIRETAAGEPYRKHQEIIIFADDTNTLNLIDYTIYEKCAQTDCDACEFKTDCQAETKRIQDICDQDLFHKCDGCKVTKARKLPIIKHFVKRGCNGCSEQFCKPVSCDCRGCGHCSYPCLDYLLYRECATAHESAAVDEYNDYYRYEYNQRSSVSKYMHEVLRFRLFRSWYMDEELGRFLTDPEFYAFEKLLTTELLTYRTNPEVTNFGDILRTGHEGDFLHSLMLGVQRYPDTESYNSDSVARTKERLAVAIVEHIRWHTYMLTEGYSYHFERDDLAKLHNCMFPVSYLTMHDIRKDV
jgi:hypothetical protein